MTQDTAAMDVHLAGGDLGVIAVQGDELAGGETPFELSGGVAERQGLGSRDDAVVPRQVLGQADVEAGRHTISLATASDRDRLSWTT